MGKWYGTIGYAVREEVRPSVWEDVITEYNYFGDTERNPSSRSTPSGNVNDNIIITNVISFVADPFARQHFHLIRYAEYMGVLWKVTNAEVRHPRLVLTLGDVYNGKKAKT